MPTISQATTKALSFGAAVYNAVPIDMRNIPNQVPRHRPCLLDTQVATSTFSKVLAEAIESSQ